MWSADLFKFRIRKNHRNSLKGDFSFNAKLTHIYSLLTLFNILIIKFVKI